MARISKTWNGWGVLLAACLLVFSGDALCADKREMTRDELKEAQKDHARALVRRIQESGLKLRELQTRATEITREAADPNRRRSIDALREESESIRQAMLPLQKQLQDDQEELDRLFKEFVDGPASGDGGARGTENAVPDPPASEAEKLVLKLATADLSSKEHIPPKNALYRCCEWTGHILKEMKRQKWTMTTVRKEEDFEFVEVQTDGFVFRNLPEIVMFGFTPDGPRWQDDLGSTILAFLKANVQGDWDKVELAEPKKQGNLILLESKGGFSDTVGTARNSFIAVVVEKTVWIALPRRLNFGGSYDWGFTINRNKRFFSQSLGER